ncbi:hypothetical protein [Micromonospora haikouensis]|uniref:hypothetical protein n=1 Tax=Micromonospora haikouensis TaxID=686309 RepID=UPI003790B689
MDAPAPAGGELPGTSPAGSSDGPAGRDGGPERARPEPPAWQGLPPIQRVLPDEPRLNRPDEFTGSLAAWRDPSYLAPLGHLVGTAEPAGVLHDAAVPVSEPPPSSDPEPANQLGGGDPATLPLAMPGPRPATRSLQRLPTTAWAQQQVSAPSTGRQSSTASTADHPSGGTRADRPQAGQLPDRPVPVEPVPIEPVPTVSRLLTAPPPPEALHLPTVDLPSDPQPAAAPPDGPTDPPQAPTLGMDAPTPDDATPSTQDPTSAQISAARSSVAGDDLPGPAGALAGGGAAREMPIQRVPGDGDQPRRRLGLGEPIVSPVSPGPGPTGNPVLPPLQRPTAEHGIPQIQRSPAESGSPQVHHSPAGGHAPPLVQHSPATPGGQRAEARGPGASGSAASRAGGPASASELPVARFGGTPGGAPPAPSDGDATDAGTEASPSVQPYVPPSGESLAPLLGQPPEATPFGVDPLGASPGPGHPGGQAPDRSDAAAEPVDGAGAVAGASSSPDLPVVSRLASSPEVRDEHGFGGGSTGDGGNEPSMAGLVGGDGVPAGSRVSDGGAADPGIGGAPTPGVGAVPALSLVVARLVGDRSPPLLTGAVPATPAPQQPSVQRVTWQRDETPAPAPAARVAAPEPRGPDPAVSVQSYVAPGDPGTPTPTGAGPAGVGDAAPAGGGLPPVQRWVGALPGTPPGSLPGGTAGASSGATAGAFSGTAPGAGAPSAAPSTGDTAHAGPPLSAYPMVVKAVVQRAEAFDEPPPPADPPAPPADGPGGAAAAGQPAAPGGPAAGGGVEPEELLKKLYDPLLRRLKTELRLDRERHGVLGGPG